MANQLQVKSDGARKRKLTSCCAAAQSNNNLFLNQKFSDVCFLVGDKREKIYAHRIFLAAESEVFERMFYGKLKETRNEIEIPDLSPVGFRNMLKYFYIKKVEEIDLSEIYPTYMAANKYLAFGLIKDLTDHITKNCLDASNVCMIYDQLLKLNIDDSLTCEVQCRMTADFSAACASDSFKQIDNGTLVSILNFNWLDITELDLIKACLQWTDSEVARKGVVANQANKRTAFEPIKHLIRFGDLSLKDFASIPEIKNYVTMEEVASVFLHLSNRNEPIQIDYRSPRRSGPKAGTATIRYGKSTWNSAGQTQFSISSDRRVRICSIKTSMVFCSASLKVEVYRDNKWVALDCKIKASKGINRNSRGYHIEFTYVLEPNIKTELRFVFSATSSSSNVQVLATKEMSLRSDDGKINFKLESDLNFHCINCIEFHGPLN